MRLPWGCNEASPIVGSGGGRDARTPTDTGLQPIVSGDGRDASESYRQWAEAHC
ncbi:MAG: hypothetical protein LBT50_06345 [Prevotellaceae bacterium]|nr:hypothetical protein [Prevotellaceae bacterium]